MAARLDDVERLPTQWCGYEGVDAVILSTSQPEIYRKLAADSAQVQALDEWVRMGGRLVLCVGAQADEDSGRRTRRCGGSPPAGSRRWCRCVRPGRWRAIAEAGRRCRRSAAGKAAALRVPRLADVQGTVEAREADLPLVVRTARGFGQVIFVAADLDQPPLSTMVRPAAAGGQAARHAHRPRRGGRTRARP